MKTLNPHIFKCVKNNFSSANMIKNDEQEGRIIRCYEIILIDETRNEFIFLNDVKYPVEKGLTIFACPDDVIRMLQDIKNYTVVFDFEHTRQHDKLRDFPKHTSNHHKLFLALYEARKASRNEVQSAVWITKRFDLYYEILDFMYQNYLKNDQDTKIDLTINLLFLITKVMEEIKENQYIKISKSENKNTSNINSVKRYIMENLKEDLCLDVLCEEFDIRKESLCRIFKKYEGITISEFINTNRIVKAKRYLLETNKSIEDICYDCGFQSVNYFYKLFKQYEQKTPQQYRKHHSYEV